MLQLRCSLSTLPPTHHIILYGNFNVPHINWDTTTVTRSNNLATDLCDIVNDLGLQQLVTEPTRQSSILDLVLINLPARTTNVEVVDGILGTDHRAVQFNIFYSTPRHNPPSISFKKANFNHFRDVLSTTRWNCCFVSDSIECAWSNFYCS